MKISPSAFKQLINLTELDLSDNYLTKENLQPPAFEVRLQLIEKEKSYSMFRHFVPGNQYNLILVTIVISKLGFPKKFTLQLLRYRAL